MGTPELDSRIDGLRNFLATNQGDDNQRATESYEEAQWMLGVLDRFFTISGNFEIVIVSEGPSPIGNHDAPMIVSEYRCYNSAIEPLTFLAYEPAGFE